MAVTILKAHPRPSVFRTSRRTFSPPAVDSNPAITMKINVEFQIRFDKALVTGFSDITDFTDSLVVRWTYI
jgi:hypothetical protein